jgi:CheY-like chemotaxis protein
MTTKQQAKILIADDERAITDGLSAILGDEGYTVDVAVDGQKALERLTNETYGVVLADLKMPKLDGLALLKATPSASSSPARPRSIPPCRPCARAHTTTSRSLSTARSSTVSRP